MTARRKYSEAMGRYMDAFCMDPGQPLSALVLGTHTIFLRLLSVRPPPLIFYSPCYHSFLIYLFIYLLILFASFSHTFYYFFSCFPSCYLISYCFFTVRPNRGGSNFLITLSSSPQLIISYLFTPPFPSLHPHYYS
jgi:hypothetical protein